MSFTGILSQDLPARKRTDFHETNTGDIVVSTKQDIKDIIETNRARYAQVDERARWNEGDLVASIPLVVWNELVQKGIAYDDEALLQWLDDRDNLIFRTRPGKLSR